jgi:hypothetical protein
MASKLWTLDDFKDFETIDKVFFSDDINNTDCYKNDSEGYTPLCFAALNGVAPECIAYFMWKANRNEIFNKCNRGKTPLQFACMSMNPITINVLTSNSYNYDRLDTDGQPVYKKDEYGDIKLNSNGEPAWLLQNYIPWKTDSFGNIEYELRNDGSSYVTAESTNGDMIKADTPYICASVQFEDILSAASLPKSDILKTLVNVYKESFYIESVEFASIIDHNDNNPLHIAVGAQCYDSVDFILANDADVEKTTASKNKDNNTPLDIAISLDDSGLVSKLITYYTANPLANIVTLDRLATYYFSTLQNTSNENDVLDALFSSKYTFYLLDNEYHLSDISKTGTLLEYCRNKDTNKTNEMINSLCNVFTNYLCTDLSDIPFGTDKLYIIFIIKLVTIHFTEAITALYILLEESRTSDPEWVTKALTSLYRESAWTSKTAMIDDIENKISSFTAISYNKITDYYIGETEDDYNNSDHDVIPYKLWNIDTLINNNLESALKRLWIAYSGILSVSDKQVSDIERAVINGDMDFDLVSMYTSSVTKCIHDKNYTFLNWLHDNDHISGEDLNAVALAVNDKQLDSTKLNNWPWNSIVTLSFASTSYQGLIINLPDSISSSPGEDILLPEITGTYTDTNNNVYRPLRWNIGDFNSLYTLNDNTTAEIVCESVTSIITFTNTDHPDLQIELPDPSIENKGTVITLPEITGTYTDTNNIQYNPDHWIIDGDTYQFGAQYTLNNNTSANLYCIPKSVTLTFTNRSYENVPFQNYLPDILNKPSGSIIELPPVLGSQLGPAPDNSKLYTPRSWDIGPFNSSYTITKDTVANLVCEVHDINQDAEPGILFDQQQRQLMEGDSSTSTFMLATQPTADVTVNLTSSNPDRLEIIPSTFTLTQDNWESGKSIKFNAINNNIIDDNCPVTITANTKSNDSNYNNLSADAEVFIINNTNVAGIIANPSKVTLTEGTSKLCDLKLKSKPTSNVTLNLIPQHNRLRISKSNLTFTSDNWDQTQTISISTPDNNIVGDNLNTSINITANTNDTHYKNLSDTLSVNIKDNDTAGIDFNSSTITLTEGRLASITRIFKLKSQPMSEVTLNLTSNYENRLLISPSSLTFNGSNWNTTQSVTFTAKNNNIAGDSITDTVIINSFSIDTNYNNLSNNSLRVLIKDNDTAGIDFDSSSITLTEGASISRTFKLKSQPINSVLLNFAADKLNKLIFSPSSLTFTSSNWNTAQSVTFTAINNNISGDDTNVQINITTGTSDVSYKSLSGTIEVSIKDNDTIGIDFDSSKIILTEGANTTRTFKLKSQPTSNVTLKLTNNYANRLSISKSSLTFTPSNWNTNQSVTFTAIDNSITDDNITDGNINITATSTDTHYNLSTNISYNINDNDIVTSLGTLAFTTSTFLIDTDVSSVQQEEPNIKVIFDKLYTIDKP